MLKKKNHLIGLDIGSRTIKASEVVASGKGYQLKNFGICDIAPGWIEEGQIKEPAQLSACISDLFKTYRFRRSDVAVSVGGYSVIVKRIRMPLLPEKKLHEAITMEAEQYIPFDINDVNLDFHLLTEAQANAPAELILVAAKKEILDGYIQVIEAAGLTPCVIDVDVFALQNIFSENYDTASENIALIDIGAVKSSINVLKSGTSSLMRDVVMGCDQINQQIVRQVNCTPEAAEQFKLEGSTDPLVAESLEAIHTEVIEEWCTETKRAIEFFYSRYSDEQIHRIVLSGGGARLARFRDKLATETGLEVEIINPFARIKVDARKLDKPFLDLMAPQLAISMGLALRKVDDK